MGFQENSPLAVCLALTRAISGTSTVDEIYEIALDALARGLGVSRASILLFDADQVMRFMAYRGLSDGYRAAVEGHTPWRPDSPDPEPIVVPDVTQDPSLAPYLPVIRAEGIAAMGFVPLVSAGRVIGKFMLYYGEPHVLTPDDLRLATLIASQIAFAVERTRAEEQARRGEARLRFALDAALMGTWDWDLATQSVRWSDNLERIHGLPAGTFDGTFASYEREIHPEDRERIFASIQRALTEGTPHEVEYRIVAPDGTVRWVEGKGRVEYADGKPVRMTGVCMIVTRRKEAEAARLAAAEEASRLKDEFLATLSHELRTPLNAILGWVQMLESGELPPDRARQAIDVIARNARLQAQIIEDILDVSRIITGKLAIDRGPVALPQLIEAVVNGATPAATAKRLDLSRTVPGTLPVIEGDARRLHQVFSNVLSNAVKFTPEGGRIDVQCVALSDAVEIAIRDSGVGIAPEFLPFIFDRFRQADSRSTRRHGGLGLGLAIARHLLDGHAGQIRAESAGPGMGTTITIRLPVRSMTDTPARAIVEREAPLGELRLDGGTVLVVDDQMDSRSLIAVLLEACGAQVLQCESAAAALEVLAAEPVRLIVADIAMPDADGYELIRRVRELRYEIPAVACSAYARPEDRQRALTSGYTGYCAKPIEAARFLRVVRDALAGGSLHPQSDRRRPA
jgi:PAS domain S-box-containing protein